MVDPSASENARPSTASPRTSDVNENSNRERLGSTDSGIFRNTHRRFLHSSPPLGFFHASGAIASNLPTVSDVKKGRYDSDGWSGPGQRRNSQAHRDSDLRVLNDVGQNPFRPNLAPIAPPDAPIGREGIAPAVEDSGPSVIDETKKDTAISVLAASTSSEGTSAVLASHDPRVPYANGYQFPPKHTWLKSTTIALHAFWKFILTPFGFIVLIYSLNVVAWGGMLFLVLIGGAPASKSTKISVFTLHIANKRAVCHPSCGAHYSKAKLWVEITSQIVNGLFNVTGVGLIPWRFRDLYYLLKWRVKKDESALRRLAGINRDWFRLQGSQDIPIHFDPTVDSIPPNLPESAFALPFEKSPGPPLTGERAAPTPYWKLDFYIWCFVWNTILQLVLDGVMWGLTRWTRPGWTTGLFISLACIVAAAGGWVIFKAGKAVKKIEGVPVSEEDQAILKQMRDLEGNNMQMQETGIAR